MIVADMYAPNQQVVREDGSGPAEEGDGGPVEEVPPPEPPEGGEGEPPPEVDPPPELDDMTKDQLLAYAAQNGIAADSSMTKAEIRSAIDAVG